MPLVAARSGQSPLAHGLSTVLDREADAYRVGVAGGKGPLRWGVENAIAVATWEDTSSHIAVSFLVRFKPK